jgi:molybdopterin-guanine dinucleotide biosynthesis protein A
MLLIGAAHRDAGKTEFACAVVRRHAPRHRLVAVKVTCVHDRNGLCPRGGDGCGVCGSLPGPYCLTEELRSDLPQDTSRLLRAGAAQSFWLRVRMEHLAEGMAALLARIPAGSLVVCESNSARQAVVPGLFVVARRADDPTTKATCAAVAHLADRVTTLHGDGWDFAPEGLAVAGGRWVLRPEATAAILAGGDSRRMGADKSLGDAGGRPLIAHIAAQLDYFPELLIGANDPAKYSFLDLPVVPDRRRGLGPLMGILSCVAHASHDRCFVTACDIPELEPQFLLDLVAQADGVDVVMPRSPDGRTEPLLAVYRKSIVPLAEDCLRAGPQRIIALMRRARVRYVPFGPPDWYRNLNAPEDFAAWRLARRGPRPGKVPT